MTNIYSNRFTETDFFDSIQIRDISNSISEAVLKEIKAMVSEINIKQDTKTYE